MKILFIANPHLNLYQDIKQELKRQGHKVSVFKDTFVKGDPYLVSVRFHKIRIFLNRKFFKVHKKYWDKVISNDSRFSEFYDLLLVLSGMSVDELLIKHLKQINPFLKTVFYTWDSCSYYRYDRLIPFFDKSYTFDLYDVRNMEGWRLLPIYYKPMVTLDQSSIEYDLFCVGTNHDGRYTFFRKLLTPIEGRGLSYYIKLVVLSTNISIKKLLKYYFYRSLGFNVSFGDDIDFLKGKDPLGLRKDSFLASEEYNEICKKSRCIIDTQRSNQTGLTARFIWALSNRKKILTTNKYALEYDFVNPEQVKILDECMPSIPIEFVKNDFKYSDKFDMSFLRIDNWVKELLSFS